MRIPYASTTPDKFEGFTYSIVYQARSYRSSEILQSLYKVGISGKVVDASYVNRSLLVFIARDALSQWFRALSSRAAGNLETITTKYRVQKMIYTACFTKIVERSKIGLCLGGGLVEAKGVGKRTIIL